jgi:Toprim domain/Phage integrase family
LIALTGARREEICALRWCEVDEPAGCLRLETTKTGRSIRPIGRSALRVLSTLPRGPSEWVFPNRAGSGSADLKKQIAGLFDAAGLTDARSHDLRRTFGSLAADEGYGDATIAELLGHARRGVTARHYIRRPDAALLAATDRVAERYLRARCITLPSPPSIRFLPHADYMPRISFPAMLAAVQRPDRAVVAVQITFLDPSGDGKAKVATPRRTVGKLGTGAVRLGLAGDALGLAEGVETALSAMQLSSVPVWACIGAGRMHTVTIPSHVHFLEIFADTDQPGRAAMLKTFERHRADLEVRAQLPHERFKDWNDYLAFQARAPMPWELVPC